MFDEDSRCGAGLFRCCWVPLLVLQGSSHSLYFFDIRATWQRFLIQEKGALDLSALADIFREQQAEVRSSAGRLSAKLAPPLLMSWWLPVLLCRCPAKSLPRLWTFSKMGAAWWSWSTSRSR